MKLNFVLNGFSDRYEALFRELWGFANVYCRMFDFNETFIICPDDADKEQLVRYVQTEKVTIISGRHYQPEPFLCKMEEFDTIREKDTFFLFGSDFASRELAVRLAYRTGGSSIVGAASLMIDEKRPLAVKMIYSNHMEGVFLMEKAPYFISIAKGVAKAQEGKIIEHTIHEVSTTYLCAEPGGFKLEPVHTDGLENADILVVAGNGVGGKDGMKAVAELAEVMGAEIGVSRSAAMNGWAPLNRMIGISGSISRPRFCLVLGVSGAAAFMAGIEKSDFIVSVNIDPEAPVFKGSDITIKDDLNPVVSELIKYLREHKSIR